MRSRHSEYRRVGGRAGTTASQGAVCEPPNPPELSILAPSWPCYSPFAFRFRAATYAPIREAPRIHIQMDWSQRVKVEGKNSAVRIFRAALGFGFANYLLFAGGISAALLFSLRGATVEAFGKYIAGTEGENAASLRNGPFLWIDGLPEPERTETTAKVKNGEVELRRLSVTPSGGRVEIPGGLIHDWEGIVFIPGVKVDDVLKILEDYNHHATYYAPDVERARIESHEGDSYRVFMRFRRHKVVTVVLDTEHNIKYYRDSPVRAHSRSSAIRISQVEDPGGADEREKQPGEDDGFLWRMETWWRLEERDGGVYVQNQVVTLTRDIPTGLGWLIEPFITNIPKETLEFTLNATRKAVLASVTGKPR